MHFRQFSEVQGSSLAIFGSSVKTSDALRKSTNIEKEISHIRLMYMSAWILQWQWWHTVLMSVLILIKFNKCTFINLTINFSLIRLEFNQSHLSYYTELDAVVLYGIPAHSDLQHGESKYTATDNESQVSITANLFQQLSLEPDQKDKKTDSQGELGSSGYFDILPVGHLLSNLENCEHLKYFRNVYCVMTNHIGDRTLDQTQNQKLILLLLLLLTV